MRLFNSRQIDEARTYAAAGHQALHVYYVRGWPGAPLVFQREAKAGRPWGHLLDQDAERLKATAGRLGVRVIKVCRPGEPQQHVDLCGGPLMKAMHEAQSMLNAMEGEGA